MASNEEIPKTQSSPEKKEIEKGKTEIKDKKSVKSVTKSKKPKVGKKKALLLPGNVRYGRKKRIIIRKVLKPHIKKKEKVVVIPITKTKKPKSKKGGKDAKEGKGKPSEKKTTLKPRLNMKMLPSYYPAEVKKGRSHDKKKPPRQYLKKSLSPGVVCIVLAGPHKGKRVVFLKQLASGLCLITGPFVFNRCPLRRINQIYLIGTTTRVDLGELFKVPDHINDKYFKKVKLNKKKTKKEEGDIFNVKPKKYVVSAVKKTDQKAVDVSVLKAIKKRKDKKSLGAYMSTKFRLYNKQFPHAIKF